MKKTQFELGEKVWYIKNGQAKLGEIQQITLAGNRKDPPRYVVYEELFMNFDECELSKTKPEGDER